MNSSLLTKIALAVGVLSIIAGAGGFYAYNKHLDQENIDEMRAMVANFQAVKDDFDSKSETGFSDFEIECATGGEKFNQSRSCNLFLYPSENQVGLMQEVFYASELDVFDICKIAKSGLSEGVPFCNIESRPSTENEIDRILRTVTSDIR